MFRQIFLLIFMLTCFSAFCAESMTVMKVPVNGKSLEITIYDTINDREQREMRFETNNLAKIVLGFGRDIDRDGIVETFFIFGKNGLSHYQFKHPRQTSFERARIVLSEHAQYSGKDYFVSLAEGLSSFLFFGVEHILKAQAQYYRDWMDLTELNLVVEENKHLLTRDEYIFALNLQMEANHLAFERLKKALGTGQAIHWGADVGMWVSGAVLLKWAARSLRAPMRAAGLGVKLSLNTYQQALRNSIKAISLKRSLQRSKNVIVKGLKNIQAEWKYIAASVVAQGTAETYVYYDEIRDPNPARLALNLLHHPDVKENVAISITDSLLMTGAYGVTQNKYARFALIGTVGAVSSYGVGVGLEGNQTRERLMFDTAWSVGVDALQTMVELNVLHRFTEAATKSRRPHLKVVGYAIVFVSQVGSYYAYSRAAQWVDPRTELHEGEIQLVPILAKR